MVRGGRRAECRLTPAVVIVEGARTAESPLSQRLVIVEVCGAGGSGGVPPVATHNVVRVIVDGTGLAAECCRSACRPRRRCAGLEAAAAGTRTAGVLVGDLVEPGER
jgi:hypothetical protein